MITGQRFDTDEASAHAAEDYAKELVLREDTDVFLLFVPKVDVDVTNGFTFEDAQYYVTTCVDPRMIAVLLGVFSGHYDEATSMYGFTYQNHQVDEREHEHEHTI